MTKIKQTLQSRKAWACILALTLVVLNYVLGWGLGMVEMLGVVSPLLAWAGIEGIVDAARVFQEGKPNVQPLFEGMKMFLESVSPGTTNQVSSIDKNVASALVSGMYPSSSDEGESGPIKPSMASRPTDEMSDEELELNIGFYQTILDELRNEQQKRGHKDPETG